MNSKLIEINYTDEVLESSKSIATLPKILWSKQNKLVQKNVKKRHPQTISRLM